jgi:hypothetical protein
MCTDRNSEGNLVDGKQSKLTELIATQGVTGMRGGLLSEERTLAQMTVEVEESLAESREAQRQLAEMRAKLHHQELLAAEYKETQLLLRQQFDARSVEIQKDRAELHSQFAVREASLRQEFENQQLALKQREALFRSQSDELTHRTKDLEAEYSSLKNEARQQADAHERAISELLRQKEQFQADFQLRMESKATEYVDTALGALQASEKRFDRIGSAWAVGGLFAVVIGLVLAYILAVEGTQKLVSNKDISWALILFFGAKGAILLGLVVSMVRVCLRLARSYLHESLKNAERRHAINYGKFYLSVYGAGTDGEKVKDVFAHWNISGTSAFSEKEDALPGLSSSDIGELANGLISGIQKLTKGEEK